LIYASYSGGGQRITAVALDELTVDDLTAVREQVPSVVAASPFVTLTTASAWATVRSRTF